MQRITETNIIGLTIKNMRTAQGLTQEQLAGLCGVGTRFIRELEHGKESCHLGKTLIVLHSLGLVTLIAKRDELP